MISFIKNVAIIAALTFIILASTAGKFTEEEKEGLIKTFKETDKDANGTIDIEEFKQFMKSIYKTMPEEEVIEMFNKADIDRSGSLDIYEIMIAINNDEYNIDYLKKAFQVYDIDNNGKISVAELRETLNNLGKIYTEEEVIEMIRIVDTDGDGQVDFQEFAKMMNISRL